MRSALAGWRAQAFGLRPEDRASRRPRVAGQTGSARVEREGSARASATFTCRNALKLERGRTGHLRFRGSACGRRLVAASAVVGLSAVFASPHAASSEMPSWTAQSRHPSGFVVSSRILASFVRPFVAATPPRRTPPDVPCPQGPMLQPGSAGTLLAWSVDPVLAETDLRRVAHVLGYRYVGPFIENEVIGSIWDRVKRAQTYLVAMYEPGDLAMSTHTRWGTDKGPVGKRSRSMPACSLSKRSTACGASEAATPALARIRPRQASCEYGTSTS